MNIVEHARDYCTKKQIAKTPIYAVQRVAAVIGNIEANQVTRIHVEQYIEHARKSGVAEWTIKGAIKDLRTIVIDAGGPSLINPVRKPKPDPKPCDIADLDLVWTWLAPWSCQLVVLTYWCGIRLEDAIRLQLTVDPKWRSITWEANKTGHRHRIPAPKWIFQWLKPVRLPYRASNDHAQVIVRGELERVCQIAGIPRILPSQIRDRGITEWSKVSSDAGALLHGHGLGTRDHYVPALEILTAAMDRVRVPQSFGAAVSSEDSLLNSFRRLDPSAQGLISMTAERLAAG
jgi:predicted transcriptional regulator